MRVAAALLVLLLAGCGSATDVTSSGGSPVSPAPAPSAPSVAVDVPAELRASLPPCPASGAADPVAGGLPDVVLACLGPGDPVRLAGLRGTPMIINLWASWCQPCRAELPALASFSREAGEEVMVLGVDAADDPQAGAQLWTELGIDFPSAADPDSLTRPGLRWIGLPVTYFVDAEGVIVYRHPGQITEVDQWRSLAREHLGVG